MKELYKTFGDERGQAAMKELYKTFGDEGGHYELECEQVLKEESMHMLSAQNYLLAITELVTATERSKALKSSTADALQSLSSKSRSRRDSRQDFKEGLSPEQAARQRLQGRRKGYTVASRNTEALKANQTVQAVYARQTAQRLISELERFVSHLHDVGSVDDNLEEELIHELQHDLGEIAKINIDQMNKHVDPDPLEPSRLVLQLNELTAQHATLAERHVEGMTRASKREMSKDGMPTPQRAFKKVFD